MIIKVDPTVSVGNGESVTVEVTGTLTPEGWIPESARAFKTPIKPARSEALRQAIEGLRNPNPTGDPSVQPFGNKQKDGYNCALDAVLNLPEFAMLDKDE